MRGSCSLCQVVVLILACGKLFAEVGAQNCGIPQTVVVKSLSATECVPSGTVLAEITVKNVNSVLSIQESAERIEVPTFSDFLQLDLLKDGKNASLRLQVNKPLCQLNSIDGNNQTDVTAIDSTWAEYLQLKALLQCGDGREKLVTFNVPIEDENTQPPLFQHGAYQVTMGPCINGTHSYSCPLNFETPILAYDRDRDDENAEMRCLTDSIYISCAVSAVDLTPQSNNSSFLAHWRNVLLYLNESSPFTSGQSFKFNLTVYNNLTTSPIEEQHLSSLVGITINFNDSFEGELLPPVHRPQFTSPVYFTTIYNMFEISPRMELEMQPFRVLAQLKARSVQMYNNLGYDRPEEENSDSDFTDLEIVYEIDTDILHIDEKTGKVYLMDPRKLEKKTEEIFQISAYPKSFKFLESRVPLLLQVRLDSGNVTESPICSSTPTTPPYFNTTYATTTPIIAPNASTTTPWTFPTTISPEYPTTISPEYPTTMSPGEPTTESSGENTVEPTENPEEPTTMSPEDPTTESSGEPTVYPEPTEYPGPTEDPTTIPPEEPTTEPTTASSGLPTTEFSDLPTTEENTQTPVPSTGTTETWIPDEPSSEPPISTTEEYSDAPSTSPSTETSTRPEFDECCYCPALNGFKCPENVPDYIWLPDLHNCRTYYNCPDGGNTTSPIQLVCDLDQIFCPSAQGCTLPQNCRCDVQIPEKCLLDENGNNITCPDCENKCFRGNTTSNHCKNQTEEVLLPDPVYYDMYHQCSNDVNHPSGLMRDCWMACPRGLYFCESMGQCVWAHQCEGVDFSGKIPFYCDKICPGVYTAMGIFLDYAYSNHY